MSSSAIAWTYAALASACFQANVVSLQPTDAAVAADGSNSGRAVTDAGAVARDASASSQVTPVVDARAAGDASGAPVAATAPATPTALSCGHGKPNGSASSTRACDCSGTGMTGLFCDRPACDDDAGSCGGRATFIAAMCDSSCALLDEGTVKCWGANHNGQLGDGTKADRSSAVEVGGLHDVRGLSVGCGRACALLSDGSVRCWGGENLGNGSSEASATPVVVADVEHAVQLVSGDVNHCAVISDGSMRCWGLNGSGALGDGTVGYPVWPTTVKDLQGALRAAAGFGAVYAWLDDGRLFGWGYNDPSFPLGAQEPPSLGAGQLLPVLITRPASVQQFALGYAFRCALLADGHVNCWGYNGDGQLGDGTNVNRPAPAPTQELPGVTQIAAGYGHACAILADSTLRCWGNNKLGSLGDGTRTSRSSPVSVLGLRDAVQVAGGMDHTCARLRDGSVYCWGKNQQGVLGNGATEDSPIPVRVVGL